MKKDILFIIPALDVGGGEKSLVNLLNEFDYNRYNVDLFLLNDKGLFMKLLPKEVNVLGVTEDLKIFKEHLFKSVFKFLKLRKFKLAYSRLIFTMKNKTSTNISKGEQYSWRYLRNAIVCLDKEYDAAIGYLEKTSNYICVDCVQAKKKIGWIHTDIEKLGLDEQFELQQLEKLDYIVTVSETCIQSLCNKFISIKDKVKVIENIVASKTINTMAKENVNMNSTKVSIVSVGRLSYEKGFDIAVKACKELIKSNINVVWYVVGDGEEKEKLFKLIKKYKIENNFIFIGNDSNPYRYMSRADIYVQPSRFEGKSIAINEAMILNKPIVTTNFSTVKDQLIDGVTGVITEMNEVSLARGIEKIIINKSLKNKIIKNLKHVKLSNESEIDKLYELIDGGDKDEKKDIIYNK